MLPATIIRGQGDLVGGQGMKDVELQVNIPWNHFPNEVVTTGISLFTVNNEKAAY